MLYNARVEISKSVKARCSFTSHPHGTGRLIAASHAGEQVGKTDGLELEEGEGARPGNYPLFRVSRGCRVSHVIYSVWDFPLNFRRIRKTKYAICTPVTVATRVLKVISHAVLSYNTNAITVRALTLKPQTRMEDKIPLFPSSVNSPLR